MRVPLSWLASHADIGDVPAATVAAALTGAGLQVEHVEPVGGDVTGVVIGRVEQIEAVENTKKPIRYVQVSDGSGTRGVICGATNFAVGDLVPVARPGAQLPGGVRIEAGRRYGRVSDGMICSGRELGLNDDHAGILVLEPGLPLGADVIETLRLRDVVLDVKVNPDRGYCLSVRGIAREAARALHVGYRDPAGGDPPPLDGPGFPVRVDDPIGCDRYVARVASGLAGAVPAPLWVQRRLTLAGMRPISLVVDVTNHVMLDLGQPLHAFDASRLTGGIVVRRAGAGETITTLDDVERSLDETDLVIADDTGAVAIAGVMGGAATEVTATTSSIVLESAHFDPTSVARTARRHRLSSEASRRFERGVDDALAPAAAETAIRLLAELGAARVEPTGTDVDHRPERPVITIAADLPARIAGTTYPPGSTGQRLAEVGCDVRGDDPLQVIPPSWRPDLRLPVDLVEEVVRLEGYDRLPSRLPVAPAGTGLTRDQRLHRQLSRAVAAAGYLEVRNPPFVSAESADRLGFDAGDPRRPVVRLANPLSEEQAFMRASLLPGLLATLARNLGRGIADVAVYEIGPVFRAPAEPGGVPPLAPRVRPSDADLVRLEAALPAQPVHLGVALAGDREPAGWWGPARPAGWADAVDAARAAAAALHVELRPQRAEMTPWHPGRCAALLVGDTVVGHAGELHPRVAEAFGLPGRCCVVELTIPPLIAAAPETVPSPAASPFPPAVLDVALVVAADVPAGEVTAAIRAGAGPLLESLRLFDVYAGPQLGEGRKSLAYALRFRAPDRTLTVEEAVAMRDAAVRAAAERTGAALRGG